MTPDTFLGSKLATIAVTLAAIAYVLNQFRKPTRWGGRFFIWVMNLRHSGLTDWGLTQVRIGPQFTILDVGCGGGRTVEKLATQASDCVVCGVDHADGSVAAAWQRNKHLVAAGRVEIQQASVSRLPYPDSRFDLVTAVETHYYWPDLPDDLKEIRRVTKRSGTLLIIAEAYKGSRFGFIDQFAMKALRATLASPDELRVAIVGAGFGNVEVTLHPNGKWICARGVLSS